MPRYPYTCEACEQSFEIEKTMDRAGDREVCPRCQGPATRVFTAPSLPRQGSDAGFPEADAPGVGGCDGCCHSDDCGLD